MIFLSCDVGIINFLRFFYSNWKSYKFNQFIVAMLGKLNLKRTKKIISDVKVKRVTMWINFFGYIFWMNLNCGRWCSNTFLSLVLYFMERICELLDFFCGMQHVQTYNMWKHVSQSALWRGRDPRLDGCVFQGRKMHGVVTNVYSKKTSEKPKEGLRI